MTIPNIADVKHWADARLAKMRDGSERKSVGAELIEPHVADSLAEFVSAILNAPGLSAKRLAEIQGSITGAESDPIYGVREPYLLSACKELIAEVLRLRTGYFTPNELALMKIRSMTKEQFAAEFMIPASTMAELESHNDL